MVSRQQLLDRSQTDWKRVAATLVITAATSVALYLAITTHSDTRTVVREREVAGSPCFRVTSGPDKGQPSAGCDRLAQLLAETCSSTPRLCRDTVNRAARRVPPGHRGAFRDAVREGLAATTIRGSFVPQTSGRPEKNRTDGEREKPSVDDPLPAVPEVGAPMTPGEPSVKTPDRPSAPVAPPARNEGPVVTTPEEAPVVTVPEVPVPPVTVPSVPEVPVVPEAPAVPSVAPEVPELGPLRSCRATKGVQPCRPIGHLG